MDPPAAVSTSCPRSSIAKSIRSAPSRTTWSSPTSGSSSRLWSNSSASRCRTWSRGMASSASEAAVVRRGLMLVLSSPSGAGKTTLSRKLLELDSGIELSVSVTTRPMRVGEVEGRDYHFIDRIRFDQMVRRGELLESALVFDHCYGTPKAPVETALDAGRDVLFDIDWQ